MRSEQLHKSIEIILSTGIMAFIMSGAISAFRLGFTLEMFQSWMSVFPMAWCFAIPAIILTLKIVSLIMKGVTGILDPFHLRVT